MLLVPLFFCTFIFLSAAARSLSLHSIENALNDTHTRGAACCVLNSSMFAHSKLFSALREIFYPHMCDTQHMHSRRVQGLNEKLRVQSAFLSHYAIDGDHDKTIYGQMSVCGSVIWIWCRYRKIIGTMTSIGRCEKGLRRTQSEKMSSCWVLKCEKGV